MADNLKDHLLAIRDKRGTLTPRTVLEEASDPAHPLHHRFTWDNDEAAEKWRLSEASQLLRVTFKQNLDSGESADLRRFWVVRDKKTATSEYVPIEEVVMNPISRTVMLRQMFRDWKKFKSRYASYTEFADMVLHDPDFADPDEEFGKNGSED